MQWQAFTLGLAKVLSPFIKGQEGIPSPTRLPLGSSLRPLKTSRQAYSPDSRSPMTLPSSSVSAHSPPCPSPSCPSRSPLDYTASISTACPAEWDCLQSTARDRGRTWRQAEVAATPGLFQTTLPPSSLQSTVPTSWTAPCSPRLLNCEMYLPTGLLPLSVPGV